jgi:magnesium and cobalt transporter
VAISEEPAGDTPRPSLFKRLSSLLVRSPEDRSELLAMLRRSHQQDLIDADALSMIEGVMQVSELSARDLMVPRSQMDIINIAQSAAQYLPTVIETGHSRFPVVEDSRDKVIGIVHAKDLLRLIADPELDLRPLLRPIVFIPESKRLNVLLRDFRINRNHMAIVVDEYGGVAGMITIEDVLEQIVGDIEDEFDFDEESDNILASEGASTKGKFRVKAATPIAQFNESFGTQFSDTEFDTLGGLLTEQLGRVPRRGDHVLLSGLRFDVIRADARQAQLFLVVRISDLPAEQQALANTPAASGISPPDQSRQV